MPSKTVDKSGKVVSRRESTQDHPDGNRARTADGRILDDQGLPVAEAEAKTQGTRRPSKED